MLCGTSRNCLAVSALQRTYTSRHKGLHMRRYCAHVNQTQLNKGLSSAVISLCMLAYDTVSVCCSRYQH